MFNQKKSRQEISEVKKLLEMFGRTGISSGQLRVQSISLMVTDRTHCNASCRYCISRTTPGEEFSDQSVTELNEHRLKIGLDFARRCGAVTAILTGKADPLQESHEYLCKLLKMCRNTLPTVDMHTNGFGFFYGLKHNLQDFIEAGLTMITFSIAHFDPKVNAKLMGANFEKLPGEKIVQVAKDAGLMVRVSLVINKEGVHTLDGILDYIQKAQAAGAHQVVVRELWVPDVEEPLHPEVFEWNQENIIDIGEMQKKFWAASEAKKHGIKFVRYLPWGTPIFDVNGLNVTFAKCEESYNGGTLKSVVHKVDGHGYMDWDHNGSILY